MRKERVLGALSLFGRHDGLAHLQFGELGELIELDSDWDELAIAKKRVGGIPLCVSGKKGQRMMTKGEK